MTCLGFGFVNLCVMAWFNGMVEFLKKEFCLMGQWWAWGIVIGPMHGYLRTPLVEGSGHHVVH